jgi:hypothetical protein
MFTIEGVALSDVVRKLGWLAGQLSATGAIDTVRESVAEVAKRLEEVRRNLEKEEEVLEADACQRLGVDLTAWAERQDLAGLQGVYDRAVELDRDIQRLNGVYGRAMATPWRRRAGPLPGGVLGLPGHLIVFWAGLAEAARWRNVARILRRELASVQALRLRPYESRASDREDPTRKTVVTVRAGLPSSSPPEGGSLRDAVPRCLRADADGRGIELTTGESWVPRGPTGVPEEWKRQRVGYFFVPWLDGEAALGANQADLVEMLFRLGWGVCPQVSAGRGSPDRLAWRLVASPASLSWTSLSPDHPPQEGVPVLDSSLTLWDHRRVLPALPECLADAATRNTVTADEHLVTASGPSREWFSPGWRIPVSVRRAAPHGEPSPVFLWSTPAFNGHPGWVERPEVRVPSVTSWVLDKPDRPTPPPARRTDERRASARVNPIRPIRCRLHLPTGTSLVAWLVDYNETACRLHLAPTDAKSLAATTGLGAAELEVPSGVVVPLSRRAPAPGPSRVRLSVLRQSKGGHFAPQTATCPLFDAEVVVLLAEARLIDGPDTPGAA